MNTDFTKSPGKNGPRRNIMREFLMKEISIVDIPAQSGAKAVLLKRADEQKPVSKLIVLTSESGGHQHSIHLDEYSLDNGGGYTSHAGDSGQEEHSHQFVVNDDGSVSISVNHDHTHEVDVFSVLNRLRLLQMVEKKALAQFGPGDYAYVRDLSDPSSWEYRLCKSPGSPPDRRLVGSVVASLSKKGALRSIPLSKRSVVIRRVRQAWLKANPSKSLHELPSVLKHFHTNS